MGVTDEVDSIAIGHVGTLKVTAPFTVLDVKPKRLDGAAKLIATRIMFWGSGTTPGGYTMTPGRPSAGCARMPVTGHGPTYPVKGLVLKPGDRPTLLLYLYADQPGTSTASGYTITYRAPDGHVSKHTGDDLKINMEIHPKGSGNSCVKHPGSHRTFVESRPDFPP